MEYDVNFMMRVNYEYSKSLLHFCLQHRIPFFYASSASTYGVASMASAREMNVRMP